MSSAAEVASLSGGWPVRPLMIEILEEEAMFNSEFV
jgi:hypothetical protein